MGTKVPKAAREAMYRLNTRIPHAIDAYVKSEVKKSKGELTEADVYRSLLEEAITNRKKK